MNDSLNEHIESKCFGNYSFDDNSCKVCLLNSNCKDHSMDRELEEIINGQLQRNDHEKV